MFAHIANKRLLLIAAALCAGFASTAGAVDLDNSPYVPKLRPGSGGPLVNGGIVGKPSFQPGSRRCYGTMACKESGTFRTDEGTVIYQNGQKMEPQPSGRQRYTKGLGPSVNHQQWCANRYRSYRTSDNTYQPLAGPRTGCNSPFQ